MPYKICLCFTVIVFVNVQCNVINDSAVLKLKRSKAYVDSDEIRKPAYNYNHPPFADVQDLIPVSIVSDNNNGRKVVTESLSSTNKPFVSEKATSEMNKQVTSKMEKNDIKDISKENSNEPYRIILNLNSTEVNKDVSANKRTLSDSDVMNEKKSKSNDISRSSKSRNVYEIPVEIVYETGEDHSKIKLEQNSNEKERKRTSRLPAHRGRGNKYSTQKPTNSFVTEPQIKATNDDLNENNKPIQIQSVESIRNTTLDGEKEAKIDDTVTSEANKSDSENANKIRKHEFKSRNGGGKPPVVPIVDSESYLSLRGAFHYKYEGGDGTKAYEQGELKTLSDERTGEAVVGGYSYKDKDGNQIELTYTADENGYRPVGAHLPTPPPIPPEIARALAHLATKTTPAPVTEPDVAMETTLQ